MRTTVLDLLPAVRRPAAAAALAAAVAAAVAATTPWLPAWSLVATVEALDTTEARVVATLSGGTASPLAWLALVGGVVAAVAAASVAVDVPVPWAGAAALVGAVLLAAVAVGLVVTEPDVARFADDPVAQALVDRTARLPQGIDVVLDVRPSVAPWLLGACATVVAVGSAVAARRG